MLVPKGCSWDLFPTQKAHSKLISFLSEKKNGLEGSSTSIVIQNMHNNNILLLFSFYILQNVSINIISLHINCYEVQGSVSEAHTIQLSVPSAQPVHHWLGHRVTHSPPCSSTGWAYGQSRQAACISSFVLEKIQPRNAACLQMSAEPSRGRGSKDLQIQVDWSHYRVSLHGNGFNCLRGWQEEASLQWERLHWFSFDMNHLSVQYFLALTFFFFLSLFLSLFLNSI